MADPFGTHPFAPEAAAGPNNERKECVSHARLGSADALRHRGVPFVRSGCLLTSRRVQLKRAEEASQTKLTWKRATTLRGFTDEGN